MWEVNDIQRETKRVKNIRIAISVCVTSAGFILLALQVIPMARSYIKAEIIKRYEGVTVSPVPGSLKREIEGEFAFWDPGKSYFENLIQQAMAASNSKVYDPNLGTYKDIIIDDRYSLPMQLTIETLGISDLHITPNVESFDPNVYNEILKRGIAHFKGTALPGEGGNSFIYGHSAVPTYYNNHSNNPEVAFTILEDIKIGDTVLVKKDGRTYTYVVRKKRVIKPTDFSILARQGPKETLTLMTCTPVGIGTDRLIVTAELKDG
jgi:LPXTG-site transpeptidase (sortase) family protein